MPDGNEKLILQTLMDVKSGQGELNRGFNDLRDDVGQLRGDVNELRNGRHEYVTKEDCAATGEKLQEGLEKTVHNSVQASLNVRDSMGSGEPPILPEAKAEDPVRKLDTKLGVALKITALISALAAAGGVILSIHSQAKELQQTVRNLQEEHSSEHTTQKELLNRLDKPTPPIPYPVFVPAKEDRHAPRRRVTPARRRARPRSTSPRTSSNP